MRIHARNVGLLTLAALAASAATAQPAPGGQVRPQAALREAVDKLLDARGTLQRATNDKEGHREKAVGLIDAALSEVRAGIAHDNGSHPTH